jgi:murein DD-endopeptidase MepM/ murein hydrolase activator NlpD
MNLANILLTHPVPTPMWITQPFNAVNDRYQNGRHSGIDYGVVTGTQIVAAAIGKTIFAGWNNDGYGNMVEIDHGGYKTLYAHLDQVAVAVGQTVAAGELIGYSGSTGNSTGPHLHFELITPENATPDWPKGQRDPSPFFVALPSSDPETSGGSEIAAGSDCKVTATDGLSLRAGKDRDTTRLAIVMYDTSVTTDEVDGEWAKVTLTGYLNTQYLQVK